MPTKFLYLDGVKYTRDEKTGYYLNSTLRKRYHRALYEKHHGPIPPGHHVHHRDDDKSNNAIENLELKTPSDHSLHHWADGYDQRKALVVLNMARAAEKAKAWHASAKGRKWHSKHAKETFAKGRKTQSGKCAHCGKPYERQDVKPGKYCSNACKSAYRRAMALDKVEALCVICGVKFMAGKYPMTTTCSRSCRATLAYRNRT